MLCFSCKSEEHISQNCSIYGTNKAQILLLSNKISCKKCLGISDKYGADSEWCEYCKFRRKCYSCFSRNHFVEDCADRFTITNYFPPNIDHDLLSRYMDILMFEERYFLLFTYPKMSNLLHPEPLNISYTNYIIFPTDRSFPDSDLVIVKKAVFNKIVDIKICLNHKNFRIQKLEICSSRTSADEFLSLLSIRTRTLKCMNVNFYPELTFSEILKKAPKLQKFDFVHSNVKVTQTWLDDLLFFNHSKHLKFVHLRIPDLVFNVENLANLIKEKHANISLIYRWPRGIVFGKAAFENLTKQLSSYFVWDKFIPSHLLQISFKYKFEGKNCIETVNFRLEDV